MAALSNNMLPLHGEQQATDDTPAKVSRDAKTEKTMPPCEKRVPYVLGLKNPRRSKENCIISSIDVLYCYIIPEKRAGTETSVSSLETFQGF